MRLEMALRGDLDEVKREWVDIEPDELWELAQLLKRTGYGDCLAKTTAGRAVDECERMVSAVGKLQRLLAGVGYAPR